LGVLQFEAMQALTQGSNPVKYPNLIQVYSSRIFDLSDEKSENYVTLRSYIYIYIYIYGNPNLCTKKDLLAHLHLIKFQELAKEKKNGLFII
jgi:hypothetical protein